MELYYNICRKPNFGCCMTAPMEIGKDKSIPHLIDADISSCSIFSTKGNIFIEHPNAEDIPLIEQGMQTTTASFCDSNGERITVKKESVCEVLSRLAVIISGLAIDIFPLYLIQYSDRDMGTSCLIVFDKNKNADLKDGGEI